MDAQAHLHSDYGKDEHDEPRHHRRTEAGQRPATIRGASPEEPNRKGTGKSSRSPAGNPGTGRVQPKPQKGNLDSEEPPTELTVFPQETSYQGTQDSSLISLRDLGIIRR